MRFAYAAVAAVLVGGVAGWFWPARADQPMPMDTPISVGATQAVCTGVGDRAESDPRWLSYPVRVEFSNRGAQYLSGTHVNLSTASGRPLASVECNGPWLLFGVPPGTYRISATLLSQP
jgi:hypothetical protein